MMDWLFNLICAPIKNNERWINVLEKTWVNWAWVIPCTLLIGLCWYSMLLGNYERYWGDEDIFGDEQGTIFAVQTVENNIAAAAYPAVIAELLLEGDIKAIHPYMYTFYGLGGLAVTSCEMGSNKQNCINEKLISSTRSWWINESNIWSLISESDFSVLTDQHEPGIDWRYKAPKNHEIMDLKFEPEGNIIGRLYYIRNEKPALSKQLYDWLKAGFQTTSTGNKYFTTLSLTYLFLLIVFLLLLDRIRLRIIEYLKYRVQISEQLLEITELESEVTKNNAVINGKNNLINSCDYQIKSLEEKKIKLTEEINSSNTALKDNQNVLKRTMRDLNVNENVLMQTKNNLKKTKKKLEKSNKILEEAKEYEDVILETNAELEEEIKRVKAERDAHLSQLNEVTDQRDKAQLKIDDAEVIRKTYLESNSFKFFIQGLNSHSDYHVRIHKDLLDTDIPHLLKIGKSDREIISLTENSINAYGKIGDSTSIIEPIDLENYRFQVYHNKFKSLRIYFAHITNKKKNLNDICIGAIVTSDQAFHFKNDGSYAKKRAKLANRLNSMVQTK